MNKKIVLLFVLTIVIMGTALITPRHMVAQNVGANQSTTDTPSLPNPLGKDVDLLKVLLRVMQVALAAVDIFALFMFILGGFQFLISAGNPNIIKRAKDTLVWATIGIVVITLSYSLMKFIFESITKTSGG